MGSCLVRGCNNPTEDGQLQCERCRAGARPVPLTLSEAEIRAQVKRWYESQGALVWDTEQGYRPDFCRHCGGRIGQASTRVTPGLSDLIVLVPEGARIRAGLRFIELKSKKGRQTPAQKGFEAACRAAGVPYFVARSVEDVMDFEDGWRDERESGSTA